MANCSVNDPFNFCWFALMNESQKSNGGAIFEEKHCSVEDSRDANFDKIENRLAYIYKFGCFNILYMEKCISDFICQSFEAKNIFLAPNLKICSLSNGPGFDIIGLLLSLLRSNIHLNCIPSFNLINLHDSWKDMFETVVNSAYRNYCINPNLINITLDNLKFIQCDIYSTMPKKVRNCLSKADILLMQRVFASSKATEDAFTKTLKEIFTLLKPGSVVFYIGSKKRTKDILEHDLVNCIFGPKEIALEGIPVNQNIVDAINMKPKQSGRSLFVVWQKKELGLQKKKKRSRRKKKKKAAEISVTKKSDDNNKSVIGEMEDYETDESSETSFTSCSEKSDVLSCSSNTASQINISETITSSQSLNCSDFNLQNNECNSNQQIVQSENEDATFLGEIKIEHENTTPLIKQTVQPSYDSTLHDHSYYLPLENNEIKIPHVINEVTIELNNDEMVQESQAKCEFAFKNENISITKTETNLCNEKHCTLTVPLENTCSSEVKLICNEKKQPLINENQILCLNENDSHSERQMIANDVNSKMAVTREELQNNVALQNHDFEIYLPNIIKSTGISANASMNTLSCNNHDFQLRSTGERNLKAMQSTKPAQNKLESLDRPISDEINKLKTDNKLGTPKKSKVKFSHKAVNTEVYYDGKSTEETLQNKLHLNAENKTIFGHYQYNTKGQEKENPQNFDSMFKHCESLVNVLERLITNIKNDESLKLEQASNQKKCRDPLKEASVKNPYCKYCCSCFAHSHSSRISCCKAINCISCCHTSELCKVCNGERHNFRSEAANIVNVTTPCIIIPVQNENLLEILHLLSKTNTA